MNSFGGISRFIGFLDECGDHSMEKLDRDFPLFVLALAVFEREVYARRLIPELGALKLKYWIHEGVNLHSREIRKQIGPFSFLHDPAKRTRFIADINELVRGSPFIGLLARVPVKTGEHRRNPDGGLVCSSLRPPFWTGKNQILLVNLCESIFMPANHSVALNFSHKK